MKPTTTSAIAPTAAPTPIPALAPVERPFEPVGSGDLGDGVEGGPPVATVVGAEVEGNLDVLEDIMGGAAPNV